MRTDIVFLSTGILGVPTRGLPLNVKSVFSGTKGNFLLGEHFIVTSWITGAIWSRVKYPICDPSLFVTPPRRQKSWPGVLLNYVSFVQSCVFYHLHQLCTWPSLWRPTPETLKQNGAFLMSLVHFPGPFWRMQHALNNTHDFLFHSHSLNIVLHSVTAQYLHQMVLCWLNFQFLTLPYWRPQMSQIQKRYGALI